jgi:hypothetical protein
MDVYFDTNIYSHIFARHRVTDADVRKLERSIESGKVQIFTSFTVIEETNAARLNALDEANGRLELIRTLAVQDKIIKHHSELIGGDIRAYANGEPMPSKFRAPYPGLRDVFWDHTAKNYKELDDVAGETINQITGFAKDLDNSFKTLIKPLVEEERDKKVEQQLFHVYWSKMSKPWMQAVADKYGWLQECRARGVSGLVKIHSLRISTIAQVSLTYANTYERTKFDRGNSRDMHHVGCASAVPTFVTHDKPLTKLLSRMAPRNLEVINLQMLLSRL